MIIVDLKEQYKLEVKCFCRNTLSKKGFIFSDSGFKRYNIFEDDFHDVDEDEIRNLIEENCVNWYGFDVMEIIFPMEDFPYLLNHQLNSYKRFTPLLREMKPISKVNKMRNDILNLEKKFRKNISKDGDLDEDVKSHLLYCLDEFVFMYDDIFYRYDKSSKIFESLSLDNLLGLLSPHFNESDIRFDEEFFRCHREDYINHLPSSDLIPDYNHQMEIYNLTESMEKDFHIVREVIESFQ